MKSIPKWIGELANLKEIDLLNNKITALPKEFYELKNLEVVNLLGNKIDRIHEDVGKLKKLRELNLASTNLRELPASFRELENLEVLYYYNNNLTSVPVVLFDLQRLQRLYINDNPINSISKDIERIESLHELSIVNTHLTEAQVDSIKKLLPFCRINFASPSGDSQIQELLEEGLKELKKKNRKDTVKITAANKMHMPLLGSGSCFLTTLDHEGQKRSKRQGLFSRSYTLKKAVTNEVYQGIVHQS